MSDKFDLASIKELIRQRQTDNQKAMWDKEYSSFMKTFVHLIATRWPKPCLGELIVQLYKREGEDFYRDQHGNLTEVYRPDTSNEHVEFVSGIGLVLEKGPDVFKSNYFFKDSPDSCDVGDWILFPRNAAKQLWCEGKSLFAVRDEYVFSTIPSPAWITRFS